MFLRSGLPIISAHPSRPNEHLIVYLSLLLAVAVIALTGEIENMAEKKQPNFRNQPGSLDPCLNIQLY